MAEQKYKLFEISIYEEKETKEVYNNYSSAFVSATSLESASEIAKRNVTGKKKVVGVNERMGDFWHE